MTNPRRCSRDGCPRDAHPGSRLRLCVPHLTGHPAGTAQPPAPVLTIVPPLPDPTLPHAYVRRDAHQSERQAAKTALPRTGTQRAAVLAAIAAGEDGATDYEVSVTIGLMPPRVATRRLELVEQGWIVDSGKRRPTPSGVDAIVWHLTAAAREQAPA